MKEYNVVNNDGTVNQGIGNIRADYVVNNNGVMTFHNSQGDAIFYYVLAPGEGLCVDEIDE